MTNEEKIIKEQDRILSAHGFIPQGLPVKYKKQKDLTDKIKSYNAFFVIKEET